jgi:hypothetical protein
MSANIPKSDRPKYFLETEKIKEAFEQEGQ